jgi:hypothetical protein
MVMDMADLLPHMELAGIMVAAVAAKVHIVIHLYHSHS